MQRASLGSGLSVVFIFMCNALFCNFVLFYFEDAIFVQRISKSRYFSVNLESSQAALKLQVIVTTIYYHTTNLELWQLLSDFESNVWFLWLQYFIQSSSNILVSVT